MTVYLTAFKRHLVRIGRLFKTRGEKCKKRYEKCISFTFKIACPRSVFSRRFGHDNVLRIKTIKIVNFFLFFILRPYARVVINAL